MKIVTTEDVNKIMKLANPLGYEVPKVLVENNVCTRTFTRSKNKIYQVAPHNKTLNSVYQQKLNI